MRDVVDDLGQRVSADILSQARPPTKPTRKRRGGILEKYPLLPGVIRSCPSMSALAQSDISVEECEVLRELISSVLPLVRLPRSHFGCCSTVSRRHFQSQEHGPVLRVVALTLFPPVSLPSYVRTMSCVRWTPRLAQSAYPRTKWGLHSAGAPARRSLSLGFPPYVRHSPKSAERMDRSPTALSGAPLVERRRPPRPCLALAAATQTTRHPHARAPPCPSPLRPRRKLRAVHDLLDAKMVEIAVRLCSHSHSLVGPPLCGA